jgi:GINS complex subunit 4
MSCSIQYEQLKKAWCAEQFSPEILHYEGELVEVHLRRLAEMERSLDVTFTTPDQKFLGNIYEMEMERIKYVLKSYLKLRIKKVNALWQVYQPHLTVLSHSD